MCNWYLLDVDFLSLHMSTACMTVWRSVRLCAPDWLSWSMDNSNVWAAPNTSKTSEKHIKKQISSHCIMRPFFLYRYGSGYTLQTKVRLSPLAEQHFAEATSHIPSGHVASTATSPV